MRFPLENYKYELPKSHEAGSFGFRRKYDKHTGVDLYCEMYDEVYAIEDGIVVNVLPFTGPKAESPWWNDTDAIIIETQLRNRVILYGELWSFVNIGDKVKEGDLLGVVVPVLKNDKGVVPSTSMLHMEQYELGVKEPVWWYDWCAKPDKLVDVSLVLTFLKK